MSFRKFINSIAETEGHPRMATVAETTLQKILSNARIKPFQVSYYCERQIRHSPVLVGLCQFAGVFGGEVVFFVGFEAVGIPAEAEGFVEEPFVSLGIGFVARVVGFVTAAGQFIAISKIHVLADHADHPDDAGQVIQVFVGDEDVTDFFPWDVGIFQLAEDAVAAASVHKEIFAFVIEDKAGVVVTGDHGIAGSENSKFHSTVCPFIIRVTIQQPLSRYVLAQISQNPEGRGAEPLKILGRRVKKQRLRILRKTHCCHGAF